MIVENSGLEGYENTFYAIDPVMKKCGFYPSWDYHKVSYDIKLKEEGHAPDYYVRIPCKVTGTVEHPECELVLQSPITFKHYYPHGLNFDAEIPPALMKKAEKILASLQRKLAALPAMEKHEH